MLNQLDTLIGFVVVMTLVSLLITLVTQMISSLLGLRGKNLADALGVMIHKLDPELDETIRKEVVQHVLTRPVISDSVLSMAKSPLDDVPVVAWFRKRWKLATAIRPQELFDVLREMAGVTPDQARARLNTLATDAQQLVSFYEQTTGAAPADPNSPLGPILARARQSVATARQAVANADAAPLDASLRAAAATAKAAALSTAPEVARACIGALRILAALHIPTPASTAAVAALTAQLPSLAGQPQAQANALIAQLNDASAVALDNLEKWFDSAQDRARQWFSLHARFWTVIMAFIIAFLLQLDAFRLVAQISSSSDLRGKLVNLSEGTLQKTADEVFSNSLSAAAINQEAVRRLNSSGVAGIPADMPRDLEAANESAVEGWLAGRAAETNLDATNVFKTFRTLKQAITQQNYDQAGRSFGNLSSAFSQTGLQLVPDPYPAVFSGQWSWPKRHLLGIVASAGLLSLGAPFWFNLLKSLSSLRPALARQIDQDDKADDSGNT